MRAFLSALLCLFASLAHPAPVEFAWDAQPDYPAGVTYEFQANECSFTGIAATSATCDLAGQPGDPLHAQVRTIAPPDICGEYPYEYQCYADSAWAVLDGVIPGAIAQYTQPGNQTNLNVARSGIEAMTISYIGYTVIEDSDGVISQSVTVPAGADYGVMCYSGWSGATARTVSSVSLGGTAGTELFTRAVSDDAQDFYCYGFATSPGAKTFALSMSGVMAEGGVAMLVWLSGVDAANALVDGDGAETLGQNVSVLTTPNLTTVDNGILVAFCTWYNTGGETLSMAAQSQSQAVVGLFNIDHYGIGYKATTGGVTAGGASKSASVTYGAVVAITLRPAAVAASEPAAYLGGGFYQ